jgi:hypothetical protein
MAGKCSECQRAPSVTSTVSGRPVCQACANKLIGAAAGTILSGPEQGIITGVVSGNMTGVSNVSPRPRQKGPETFWARWKRRIIG